VWATLRTTPLPIEVIVTHVLPRLHAGQTFDYHFKGQLDIARAASVLGTVLPDSDDTASDASSVCKDGSDDASEPPSETEYDDDDEADSTEESDDGSDDAGLPDAKRVKTEDE
jgi:hypothetical protein